MLNCRNIFSKVVLGWKFMVVDNMSDECRPCQAHGANVEIPQAARSKLGTLLLLHMDTGDSMWKIRSRGDVQSPQP